MEFFISAVLFTVICAAISVHLITHKSRSGILIDKIPGPSYFPIIGNTLDLLVSPEAVWKLLRRWADEHYPVWTVWMGNKPTINIRHPDDAEILLSNPKNLKKSFFYKFLRPWAKDGLLLSNGHKWRMRKKMLTPAFHLSILQEFMGASNDNAKYMVNSLKSKDCGVVEDLGAFLANYTLRAICANAAGTSFKNDDSNQRNYMENIDRMKEFVYYRALRPWLINDWIFSLTRTFKAQVKALKILHSFTKMIIENRKEYHESTGGKYLNLFSSKSESTDDERVADCDVKIKKKRLAMLDLLIAAQKEHNSIDDLGISEEVDTFIVAGYETTAMAMCFMILLLAEHKEIQTRARSEVDAAFEETNGNFGNRELQKLSYLERCIKETLRLYPSVPMISRHIDHDMQLRQLFMPICSMWTEFTEGFLIPGDTIVNLHIFDLHRDPNFWPNPNDYDPDRFLPEKIANRHPYSYIPFSAGARNCIGQKYAMLQMKVIMAYLLHSFHFESVTQLAEIRFTPNALLNLVEPISVKFISTKL